MRDYGKVSPTFWTGDTGRFLRQCGPETQLVALYLLTCQNANMTGLYYMPLPTLCHETGSPLEGALKALRSLSEGGFAYYDEASEVVWVPEMARYQLGETLNPKDNRHKGVIRQIEIYRKSKFFNDFYTRYSRQYHLPKPSPLEAPSEPLGRGRGRARAGEEQEQEQEQEQNTSLPGKPAAAKKRPVDKVATPSDCEPSSGSASDTAPRSSTIANPRPRDELFDAVAEVTGSDPKLCGPRIGRVCAQLRKGDPPYTAEEVRSLPGVIADQGMSFSVTIGSVEKYISWVRTPPTHADGSLNGQAKRSDPYSGLKEFVTHDQEAVRDRIGLPLRRSGQAD